MCEYKKASSGVRAWAVSARVLVADSFRLDDRQSTTPIC